MQTIYDVIRFLAAAEETKLRTDRIEALNQFLVSNRKRPLSVGKQGELLYELSKHQPEDERNQCTIIFLRKHHHLDI